MKKWKSSKDTMILIKKSKFVTVPIQYYLLLFLLAIILISISLLIPDKSVLEMSWSDGTENTGPLLIHLSNGSIMHSLFANFGYGIFGSTFVAFLVDIGATRRQGIDEKNTFLSLTYDLKKTITALIQYRTGYEQDFKIYTDDTPFYKWVLAKHESRSQLKGHNIRPFKEEVVNSILPMSSKAELLKQNAVILGTNSNINEKFIHDLDILIEVLEMYRLRRRNVRGWVKDDEYAYLVTEVLNVIPSVIYHSFFNVTNTNFCTCDEIA